MMRNRRIRTLFTLALLTGGLVAVAPAVGRAQDGSVLQAPPGRITVVGCFLRERVKHHTEHVLVSPTIGSVTSVPEAACNVNSGNRQMLELEKVKDSHLLGQQTGQWIEITGDLRKIQGDDDLRELHVKTWKIVPVVPPRAAAFEAPAFAAPPVSPTEPLAPIERPVATSGVQETPAAKPAPLPHTASALPLTGLAGFLALAGGLALLAGRRRNLDRG